MGPSQFRKLFGESDGPARGEMKGQGEPPGCVRAGLVALAGAALLASASLVSAKQCSGESRSRERDTAPTSPETPASGDTSR